MLLTCAKAAEAFNHVVNVAFQVPRKDHFTRPWRNQETLISGVWSCSMKLILIPWLMTRLRLTRMFSPGETQDHYILHCNSLDTQLCPIRDDWLSNFDSYQVSPDMLSALHAMLPNHLQLLHRILKHSSFQLIILNVACMTHPYAWFSRMANNLTLANVL